MTSGGMARIDQYSLLSIHLHATSSTTYRLLFSLEHIFLIDVRLWLSGGRSRQALDTIEVTIILYLKRKIDYCNSVYLYQNVGKARCAFWQSGKGDMAYGAARVSGRTTCHGAACLPPRRPGCVRRGYGFAGIPV